MALGYSHISDSEADVATYKGGGVGFDLLFGGTPVPGLVIGGGLVGAQVKNPTAEDNNGNSLQLNNLNMTFGYLPLFVDVYPMPDNGLNFMAMVGFADLAFSADSGSSATNDATGAAYGLGAGYEAWISSQWSLGGMVRGIYAPLKYTTGGASFDEKTTIWQIMFVATYH